MSHEFVPLESLTGRPRYWRSLDEYPGAPAFDTAGETEFPEAGTEFPESSRRRFLALMAGSLALAGLTGCTRQPTEVILPYVVPPENALPGRPKFYATAVPVNGAAEGVIVESHLGRPTKVEGNPAHPASLGASSVLAQASLMDLYDPDRSQQTTESGAPATWDGFRIALIAAADRARNGAGSKFRILTHTVTSPVLGLQIQSVLKALPGSQWHQYEPTGAHSARAASQSAFGQAVNTYYDLTAADIVVALDADFLASGPASTRYAHDFSARRRRGDRLDMNRLYVVESSLTPTGGKADHRLPLRHADLETFAHQLLRNIAGQEAAEGPNAPFIHALAQDLSAHRGSSVVIPGGQQTPAVHALAHALNTQLGNVGKTVTYTASLEFQAVDQIQSLRELVSDMAAGKVETLLILGGNPVYDAPADLPFATSLAKVANTIHLSSHFDETSAKCRWQVPESHFLEEWGEVRAFDGTLTIQQPLIAPLYDSHSSLEVLDLIQQPPGRTAYEVIRAYWLEKSGAADFEAWWRKTIHDGVVPETALPPITATTRPDAPANAAPTAASGLEIVFRPDPYIQDGRYANNVWLQELPRPMTKLTWDNAVQVSAATAARLQVKNNDVVELQLGANSVEGAVWVSPGQPDNSVTVHLGYGRWQSGRAGTGAGFNAYRLRRSDSLWSAPGVEIRKTGKTYPLATTQLVHSMKGRDLIISARVEDYKTHPDFAQRKSPSPAPDETLYKRWDYTGYAWGMSIDLTACVNCNACVAACQAENNIPVVGKEQVLARRAMHWLRVDTYFEGQPENPAAYYQPVPCMQCEDAPCELVCPTQATNHSSDGLNDMVYNRCVGTRYCSNNCPYKVRRFNFLLFADWNTESWKLQRNPDVTVRSRGVMEKCTYCVQRIRETEIRARDEDRYIRDGEIQTACQQACPTQAIVFGDINNPANRVARLKSEKLNYALLAELNTRPRTTYLGELRNPNPALEASRT